MGLDFKSQRVLVVGASGGIGAATARAFTDAGARVVAAGRPSGRLQAIADEVGSPAAELDILDNGAIEAFFAREDAFDHVAITAAATKTGPVGALALDDARASMESKFWGAYRVARAARVIDSGSITFVSGFLAVRPSPGAVLQGAINAAVEALGRGLALERAPVRVNTVSPGLINTPLWRAMPGEKREALFGKTAKSLPVQRVGRPEDIAQAILFLAASSFATGTTVTVDGGGSIA